MVVSHPAWAQQSYRQNENDCHTSTYASNFSRPQSNESGILATSNKKGLKKIKDFFMVLETNKKKINSLTNNHQNIEEGNNLINNNRHSICKSLIILRQIVTLFI